jgi:phage tail sheath protein FI
MAGFMLSPGVQVVEKDFTNIVPAVSTSIGATAGSFQWGPVMEPVRISSENELVQRFGRPNNGTFHSFYTAANFLAYSNNLLLVRTDNAGQKNAVATQTGTVTAINVTLGGSGYSSTPVVTVSAPQTGGGVQATATATVVGGIITAITITNPGSGYTSATVAITDTTGTNATATVSVTVGGIKINNFTVYQEQFENGAGIVGEFAAKYPGTLGNSIRVAMADSASYTGWDYAAEFEGAPGADELHLIVIDADGKITGFDEGIIEKFAFLSKANDGRRDDGTATYYKHVVNSSSRWIYWMDHPVGTNWGAATGTSFSTINTPYNVTLSGGTDDFAATNGAKQNAFALFDNDEQYDISLIMAGKAAASVANFIISNVAEKRKDCVVFVSPEDTDGSVITGTGNTPTTKVLAYKTAVNISSSYGVMDTGYKYQYDRYNDVYRWVPLNGDVAGLCARTDFTADPWFSPAGYNRGQIKNVVKLAFNPSKTDRDTLYPKGINPVVSFPGEGTVLYGDRTMLSKPSAFDRINVRRLFIVLEKAIATAAKYQLFEFNDTFTRAQFRSMVEPFLRDVQGRRGITDFRVVCDESNNTGEVIDGNRFVADMYIKPARSINFITLNFVAVRTGVSFEEIIG